MKPPKRPRNVPITVSQQPAGPAKKFRKGKVPSTRGALSKSQNTTRTVQVSRAATNSNLAIARCQVINIVSDAHQEPPFVLSGLKMRWIQKVKIGNEGDAPDQGEICYHCSTTWPQRGESSKQQPWYVNCLKCFPRAGFWVKWLITLLDSAGFFHPIKVEAQEVLKQLSAGRHKPVKRDLSDEEMVHLKKFYQTDNVIPHITIYHHATTKKGSYRDTSIGEADQREKCSMVLFDNCVGSIDLFFSMDWVHSTR
ncbi:Hypothetical predicted protein [Mytilus galloprovincialis]|uniref:Uncharacterized protein n=1 Tax=Mytilus galloprovincialis TaxID=29158 RepID=A0A8B6EGF4_MYTGA|nr:Hypothetical predicted protein [Mytilus galloprovincialis]